MSILDSIFRTATCNGPNCTRTVTFEQKEGGDGMKEVMENNPWLRTARIVQPIIGGRNFLFCSDNCEIESVATGAHNPEERKKVVLPDSANAVQMAAQQAAAAEHATKALKTGSGVTLERS